METPKSEVFFKMKPMTWGPKDSGLCFNCRKAVRHLENYFYDVEWDRDYCDSCGKRLRYHRRKWSERGWPLPADFATVDKKMKALGLVTTRRNVHVQGNRSR